MRASATSDEGRMRALMIRAVFDGMALVALGSRM